MSSSLLDGFFDGQDFYLILLFSKVPTMEKSILFEQKKKTSEFFYVFFT